MPSTCIKQQAVLEARQERVETHFFQVQYEAIITPGYFAASYKVLCPYQA